MTVSDLVQEPGFDLTTPSMGYPVDIKQGASEKPSRSMIIIPYYLREMLLYKYMRAAERRDNCIRQISAFWLVGISTSQPVSLLPDVEQPVLW